MKKSLQLFALLFCMIIFAQAPEKFSYQAVIRNGSGVLIQNAPVGLKISILKTSVTGTVVYSESQTATTNLNGLISIQVGSGTLISGTIAGIDWSADSYYIKTEVDPSGGTTYSIAGTTQLLSVPYALYSKNSGSGSSFTLPYVGTANNAASLLQVTNTGAGSSLEGINNSVTDQISAVKGVINSTTPGAYSTAVRGVNNGTSSLGIGVWGSQEGSGFGVYGVTPAGYSVLGSTQTGTAGYFTSNDTGKALVTEGPIRFSNIGAGAGKVLTSDASGNATWQNGGAAKVHLSSTGGSSQSTPSGIVTVVNTWLGLDESGGANYNATTGEYTIPVTGYYAVKAQISFSSSNTIAGAQSNVRIQVDGNTAKQTYTNNAVIGQFHTDASVNLEKTFTVGQKVRIAVVQNGSATNNLFPPATNFSIHLIHQ
ncbi:hypothetical protein [Kaistella antarctica]|uniref:C1q domain-containing protein n=1 Tax=Kaistella antarctica TaxID=266748 RepID=A0A448NPQ6_9FLAO|nr:hypothetical protein [Kaistella antarctica]SEW05584.1 hypothetical protein SAMN05421765_2047 [Kaistella antarctica]VEH98432.1 Uncharacterised protein [Kaistella antarctica]